jgi:UDP-2,4-diacetamido-2,4,6-trideoxy-beta-L-altropyranose hydrolase
MLNPVYFRVDASAEIGYGHLIRCIAFAQIISPTYQPRFFCRYIPDSLKTEVLKDSELEVIESEEVFLESLQPNTVVVLDGYHFDTKYQIEIKNRQCKLICIDDLCDKKYVADAIINYGPAVTQADYNAEPYTKFFLGLKYVLLRKEFRNASTSPTHTGIINRASKIFVSFGGSDQHNLTMQAAGILIQNGFNQINILIGESYKHQKELNLFKQHADGVHIYRSVSPEKVVEIMSDCHLAIVPASTVMLELFSLGIPVISGYYVDNQKPSLKTLEEKGLIVNIGDMLHDFEPKLEHAINKISTSSALDKFKQAQLLEIATNDGALPTIINKLANE